MCRRCKPAKKLKPSQKFESRNGEIKADIRYFKTEIWRQMKDHTRAIYILQAQGKEDYHDSCSKEANAFIPVGCKEIN